MYISLYGSRRTESVLVRVAETSAACGGRPRLVRSASKGFNMKT
jgi:hypothetical protein